MMNDHFCKSARLFKDDGKYYLDLIFQEEDEYRVTETHVPRVELPLNSAKMGRDFTCNQSWYKYFIELPSYALAMCPSEVPEAGMPVCFTKKVIKEKTISMTKEEIEEKLGYKIDIVDKKHA